MDIAFSSILSESSNFHVSIILINVLAELDIPKINFLHIN